MRIISKFKDYYDNAAPYDTDPKRVFVRETKELDRDDFPELTAILKAMPAFNVDRSFRFPIGVVAFCGKAYPYYYFDKTGSKHDIDMTKKEFKGKPREHWLKFCYSFDQVWNFWEKIATTAKNHDDKIYAKKVLKSLKEPEDPPYLWDTLTEKTWDRFLESTPLEVEDSVFLKAGAPVIHLYTQYGADTQVVTNPRLGLMGFQSIVVPYTAYQEIEMFLGTNLVQQMDPEVHVSDEVKAESRGFNKFSFRKDPSKKRKRRKNRK